MEETIYNSYESTLKRLIQILKTKTTDNVKQLEDLWDSISVNQPNGIKNTRISPTISSSSQSPIHLSDSSNDSTNSISNNLKREASKMCPSPVNSSTIISIKKPKITNEKYEPIELSAVDMLDFSCSVCKQFNQDSNNKLIECKQCTHLYHQMCHSPKIENSQLELNDQMVSYVTKCNKCLNENEQVDLEVNKINSFQDEQSVTNSTNLLLNKTNNSIKNSNGFIKNDSVTKQTNGTEAWNFKKEKTSPTMNQSCLKSNSLSSFSNLTNNNAINNITLNSSSNNINSNGKSNLNSTGIKGLAALATKLNPNGTSNSTTTSNLKKPTPPPNPDSLFKKFKESASSITQSTTNENDKKLDLNLGKKTLNNPLPSSDKQKTVTSNSLTNKVKPNLSNLNGTNLLKKNPFNISNSLTTKTSCVNGLNNLKDKKNHIKTSTLQTSSNSAQNSSRSSKIS